MSNPDIGGAALPAPVVAKNTDEQERVLCANCGESGSEHNPETLRCPASERGRRVSKWEAATMAANTRGTDSQHDAARAAIIDALRTHRMVHMFEVEDDGLGNSYPLLDRLSLGDGIDIASGAAEIEAIADAVLDALDAAAVEVARQPDDPSADMPRLVDDEQFHRLFSAAANAASIPDHGKRARELYEELCEYLDAIAVSRHARFAAPSSQAAPTEERCDCLAQCPECRKDGVEGSQAAPDAKAEDRGIGFPLYFTREQWGVIVDGVMLESARSEARKAANSESNSDERVEMCRTIIRAIGHESSSTGCAAPSQAAPAATAELTDEQIDAQRWRYSMEFQDGGGEQPKPIVEMWRKVYAEHRLQPTRAEYEAAIDAAILAAQAAQKGA